MRASFRGAPLELAGAACAPFWRATCCPEGGRGILISRARSRSWNEAAVPKGRSSLPGTRSCAHRCGIRRRAAGERKKRKGAGCARLACAPPAYLRAPELAARHIVHSHSSSHLPSAQRQHPHQPETYPHHPPRLLPTCQQSSPLSSVVAATRVSRRAAPCPPAAYRMTLPATRRSAQSSRWAYASGSWCAARRHDGAVAQAGAGDRALPEAQARRKRPARRRRTCSMALRRRYLRRKQSRDRR